MRHIDWLIDRLICGYPHCNTAYRWRKITRDLAIKRRPSFQFFLSTHESSVAAGASSAEITCFCYWNRIAPMQVCFPSIRISGSECTQNFSCQLVVLKAHFHRSINNQSLYIAAMRLLSCRHNFDDVKWFPSALFTKSVVAGYSDIADIVVFKNQVGAIGGTNVTVRRVIGSSIVAGNTASSLWLWRVTSSWVLSSLTFCFNGQ